MRNSTKKSQDEAMPQITVDYVWLDGGYRSYTAGFTCSLAAALAPSKNAMRAKIMAVQNGLKYATFDVERIFERQQIPGLSSWSTGIQTEVVATTQDKFRIV